MVEETSAAGATLANEAGRLGELIGHFQLGGIAGGRPVQKVDVSAVSSTNGHWPVASPVRRVANTVSKAFSGQTAPAANSWEEFR